MIGGVLAVLSLLIAIGILLGIVSGNWLAVAVVLLASAVVFGHIKITNVG